MILLSYCLKYSPILFIDSLNKYGKLKRGVYLKTPFTKNIN